MRCSTARPCWTHERLVDFCHEHLFNGIPQEGLGRGMHRIFKGLKEEELLVTTKDFVQSMLCSYLARHKRGVSYPQALAFCREAQIDKVLQATKIGGNRDWTISMFLTEDMYEEHGGQQGLKENAKKFFTHIVANSQPLGKVTYICNTCQEPTAEFKGKRLKLETKVCNCDHEETLEQCQARQV